MKGLTNYHSVYHLGIKCKIATLTNFCIIMYVDMACIMWTDDISITRSERVNEKLYFITLSRTMTSFHAKVQVVVHTDYQL